MEYDPTDIAAQDAAKGKETEAQRLKRDREVEDFKFLMSSVQGRRFVWRMLDKAGVFRTSFSLNGLQMAMNEGNRNMGLMLISEIHEHCPERYHQMVKEHRDNGNRSRRPN